HADHVVWIFTLIGASMLAVTLVSLGVALGAFSPNFSAENPLQVGLSLGGFAYMAISLAYVGVMMLLMPKPVIGYIFWPILGITSDRVAAVVPVVTAVTLSAVLTVFPLLVAERRLARREKQLQSRRTEKREGDAMSEIPPPSVPPSSGGGTYTP